MKKTLMMLGLAAALMAVAPSQAHAGVVVGVRVGPVVVAGPVCPRPGYAYVHPAPWGSYAGSPYPYAYAPGPVYARAYWGPRGYPRYGHPVYVGRPVYAYRR